jgi:molybdopterin adenylyltransferase
MKTVIMTISTSVAAGDTTDVSGPALAELATAAGAEIVATVVLPDDRAAIEDALQRHAAAGASLIFTTGGTGLTPDDVTPEATGAVIDRDVPGFAEAMRAEAFKHTPLGILTRGVSGTLGRTLIINFPGSPKAIRELFPVIAPTLEHAVETLHREGGRAGGGAAGATHGIGVRHAGH